MCCACKADKTMRFLPGDMAGLVHVKNSMKGRKRELQHVCVHRSPKLAQRASEGVQNMQALLRESTWELPSCDVAAIRLILLVVPLRTLADALRTCTVFLHFPRKVSSH